MPMPLAEKTVEEAAKAGFRVLWITGGEPMLFPDDVLHLVEMSRDCGLRPVVQTDTYWARTLGEAIDTTAMLKQRGVKMIAISTDQFHVQFVPMENVLNAVRACKKNDIHVIVNLSVLRDDPVAEQIHSVLSEERVPLGDQPVVPFGRAKSIPRSEMITSTHAPNSGCFVSFVPNVLPDGTVVACCGPYLAFTPDSPLILGNAKRSSLVEILHKADRSPLLNILRLGGPAGLLQELEGSGVILEKPTNCVTKCELCMAMLSRPEVLQSLCDRLGSETRRRELACAATVMINHLREEIVARSRKSRGFREHAVPFLY